jgi:short-subunit dehydrogenase
MKTIRDVRLAKFGPWALVTGATDGIGREFATQLAQLGFNLVLVSRRDQVLEALGQALTAAHGIECRVFPVDLADLDATDQLLVQTQALDIGLLVAAAGFGSSGPLLDGDLATELGMIDLNCRSVLLQATVLGRRMRQRGSGGMILLSSLLAFHGTPWSANYAATKAYVQSLAEALHVELAPHGVDVLACAPGPVHTGFAQRASMTLAQAASPEQIARASLRALGQKAFVRPGALSKLLGWSLGTAPRALRVKIMGQLMKKMSAPATAP